MAADARRVVDDHARFQRGAQAVQRGDPIGRKDGRAAAAERAGSRGVRAQDRDPPQGPRIQRQQGALVAGEHEAGGRGGAQQLARRARRSTVRRSGSVARSHAPGRARRRGRPAAAAAGPCRRSPPRRPRPARTASARARRPTARPVRASRGPAPRAGGRSVARGAYQSDMTTPSKPHSSLRTSASSGALGHRVAVDAVVGGHHRPRPRLGGRSPRTARGTARAGRARRRGRRAVKRSVSESLATKCLTVAPTPPRLQPAHVGGADRAR